MGTAAAPKPNIPMTTVGSSGESTQPPSAYAERVVSTTKETAMKVRMALLLMRIGSLQEIRCLFSGTGLAA